jgi:hypothetical protein
MPDVGFHGASVAPQGKNKPGQQRVDEWPCEICGLDVRLVVR